MIFRKLAAIALMLSFATAANADVAIPKGKCAFIVASRSSIDEVNGFLAGVDDSLQGNLQVVESSNGWYAISVGVIPEEDFDSIKARRVAAGIVPADSLCSNGTKYTRVLDEDEYVLPVKVDVSNWVPVGPNAPSLAPTGRAPIAFKRPLREGEPVITLCPKKGLGCQYVDETGAALTDRVFEASRDFESNQPTAVSVNGRWGYIGSSGSWIVEPVLREASAFSDDGLAAVQYGDGFGFLKSDSSWLVAPKLEGAGNFAPNGLANADLGGRTGFINTSGAWEIEPKFEYAGPFSSSGLAMILTSDNKRGFVGSDGDVIVTPKFQAIGSSDTGSRGENALIAVKLDGKWGFINTIGDFVILPKFDQAQNFADNGLAPAEMDGLYGYIDKQGKWQIEPRFEWASVFAETGIARAKFGGNLGVVDTSGAWVVEPLYDEIVQVAGGMFRVDFGNGQYQGLLKPDGTPLTFTQEEFRMAEIEGNQKRLEEELAKKDDEIKRLQEEAANAQAAAASAPQVSSACDHVYVGKLFEGKMGVAGQLFGLKGTYEVLGFSANTEQVTITLTTDRSFRQQITCSQVPY